HANEKDDKKPKVTARKMIEMMMAINKNNFEGHREVTCYSCHRGSTDPVATPIITDEEPRAAGGEGKKPDEAKTSLPAADQLLDKYLAAIGGVDAGEKIDGHETYMVVGRTEGQPPLRLYLDKESSLLLRLVRYAETPLGRNPTQIDYADYRDANGVKVPFRWNLARPGNRFVI